MAAKAMNFKMDEEIVHDMRNIAAVYNITLTEAFRQAAEEYIERMKDDPFYRLTANIQDASAEETEEVIAAIDHLTDDDLSIVSTETFSV